MKTIKRITVLLAALAFILAGSCASAEAKAIRLNYKKASLQVGKSATLKVKVSPSGSKVSWQSSDTSVATVNQSGRVTAVSAGTATITAKSGSVSARCALSVKSVRVSKVSLSAKSKSLALSQGTYQLTAKVKPAGADKSTLTWKSSNTAVASVDQSGLVTLKKAGTAKIAAVSPSGKKAVCTVTITGSGSAVEGNAAQRALVIGEGRANAKFGLAALPMVQSEVSDIAQMMRGNGITTSTLVNSTRSGVLSAIQKAFAGATESDVSYLYITCHGGMSGGSYLIFPCGDGYLSAAQLRKALDAVKGKVVLMLGSCQSGSVIAKSVAGGPEQFLSEFVGAQAKAGEFASSKYQVLCACRSSENGYGVVTTSSKTGEIVEEYTFNFFGKSVEEGGAGAADANADGAITLSELYGYVKGRVSALHVEWRDKIGLSASDTQTVVAYPASSSFVLFS